MAYLNDGGKQMVNNSPGETSLSGPQHQELPTKSSSIQSPGREQKAKRRVSQALFIQQLAGNQQVSKPSTSQRQQERNSVQVAETDGQHIIGEPVKSLIVRKRKKWEMLDENL